MLALLSNGRPPGQSFYCGSPFLIRKTTAENASFSRFGANRFFSRQFIQHVENLLKPSVPLFTGISSILLDRTELPQPVVDAMIAEPQAVVYIPHDCFRPRNPEGLTMFIVCVHVHVKPEHCEDFIAASLENAQNTIQEPGNLRFDVLRQADDPNRFLLYEVYRDETGMKAHKETMHYAKWAEAVAPWMAEPRKGIKHSALFPQSEKQWVVGGE